MKDSDILAKHFISSLILKQTEIKLQNPLPTFYFSHCWYRYQAPTLTSIISYATLHEFLFKKMHKEQYFYEQEQVNTHAISWYNANTSICLVSSFSTWFDLQKNRSATQQLENLSFV